MTQTPEQIAASLTKAQRKALLAARWSPQQGVWHPEGYYCTADKRVRYNLCLFKLMRDYVHPSNIITPLGLSVRAILESQP